MGTTLVNKKTYPRLASVIGFCTTEQGVDVAEKVMLVQRDYGDRVDRKVSMFSHILQCFLTS